VSSIPIFGFAKEISLKPRALLNRKKFFETNYKFLFSKAFIISIAKLLRANSSCSKIYIIHCDYSRKFNLYM
jgi:hypothetical protein